MEPIVIEHATPADAAEVARIEGICFPEAEAATLQQIEERIAAYPECFWLLKQNGRIVTFINGMATSNPHLLDEMFADATLHEPEGAWQMIFSVATDPEFRKQGLAGKAINTLIEDARAKNRTGIVLTCKDHLVHYYEGFGFVDEGICASEHGGVSWHEMRLTF